MERRGPDWSFYKTPKKNIFIGQTVLSMTGKIKKDLWQQYSISYYYFLDFYVQFKEQFELSIKTTY